MDAPRKEGEREEEEEREREGGGGRERGRERVSPTPTEFSFAHCVVQEGKDRRRDIRINNNILTSKLHRLIFTQLRFEWLHLCWTRSDQIFPPGSNKVDEKKHLSTKFVSTKTKKFSCLFHEISSCSPEREIFPPDF